MQWYLVSSLLPGFELGGTEVGYFEVEFEGAVPCLVRGDSFEGAMELIENNQFGNGVALFTRDGGMARHSAGLHEHRDFGAID